MKSTKTRSFSDISSFLRVRYIFVSLGAFLLEIISCRLIVVLILPQIASIFHANSSNSTSGAVSIPWLADFITGMITGGRHGFNLAGGAMVALLIFVCVVLALAPLLAGSLVMDALIRKKIDDESREREEERRLFYRRRNVMISDMAHDIRTPVMTISGMSQALVDGMVNDPQDQIRYLKTINAKANKMGGLVSLLFDYVQLDSEGYELSREPVNISEMLLEEVASAYSDFEEASMELEASIIEEPLMVYADKRQLARVVSNLLLNAQRHNEVGTKVGVMLRRRVGVVEVIIADTGNTIDQPVEELFEPFARGDAARAGGGSGLGLSIVKKIIDMHGYRIQLVQPYGSYTKAFVVTCMLMED